MSPAEPVLEIAGLDVRPGGKADFQHAPGSRDPLHHVHDRLAGHEVGALDR